VLVVDDEPIVRATAARILQSAGLEVVEAADGDEALRIFAEQASTLTAVLLDLRMPGRSGEEVLSLMQQDDPSVPVILTSGYDSEVALSDGAYGAAAFIQKPYRPEELLRTLRAAVPESSAATEPVAS
jgi:CheY-like chemotaxis protein